MQEASDLEVQMALGSLLDLLANTTNSETQQQQGQSCGYELRRSFRRLDRAVHSYLITMGHHKTTTKTALLSVVDPFVAIVTTLWSHMDTFMITHDDGTLAPIHESTAFAACQILSTLLLRAQTRQHMEGKSFGTDGVILSCHPHLSMEQLDAMVDRLASLVCAGNDDSRVGKALFQILQFQLEQLDDNGEMLFLLNAWETIQLVQLLLPRALNELSIRYSNHDNPNNNEPSRHDDEKTSIAVHRSFLLLLMKHLGALIPMPSSPSTLREHVQAWLLHEFLSGNTVHNNDDGTLTLPAAILHQQEQVDSFLLLLQKLGHDIVEYSLDHLDAVTLRADGITSFDESTMIHTVLQHVSLASMAIQVIQDCFGIRLCHSTVSSLFTAFASFAATVPLSSAMVNDDNNINNNKEIKESIAHLLLHLANVLAQAMEQENETNITGDPRAMSITVFFTLDAIGTIPKVPSCCITTLLAAIMASLVVGPSLSLNALGHVVQEMMKDNVTSNGGSPNPWHTMVAQKLNDRIQMNHDGGTAVPKVLIQYIQTYYDPTVGK